jgi:hypothetical protein
VSRASILPWILLAVWAAWLHALQGIWASASPWAPDLGVVMLVVLSARMRTSDLFAMGLAVGLGRLAVSVDPPVAVLAGCLGWTAACRGLRTVLVIRGALARSLLAGAGAVALGAWLALARHVRLESSLWDVQGTAWSGALATAIAALVAGPALAFLPGLSPLTRRKKWAVAASTR